MRSRGITAIAMLTMLVHPPLLLGATPEVIWQGEVVRVISTIDIDVYERQNAEIRIPADYFHAPTGDTRKEAFPELFRLDLKVTRRSTDDEGFALPVRASPLGAIFVATFLGRDAAQTAVRDVIHDFQILSAQTFRFPMPREENGRAHRWFSYDRSPFFHDPATWICFEPVDGPPATEVLSTSPFQAPQGGIGITSRDSIEMPSAQTTVCGQMQEALAEGSPGETRSSRFALETDGRLTLTVSVHRPAAGAAAVPLPDGVLLKREGTSPGEGERITSHTPIADLPLSVVRSTSVVMNWVLERTSGEARGPDAPRSTGPYPLEDWIVALYPPMMERAPGDLPPEPADWEERLARRTKTEFLESMRREFKNSSRLNAADVEKVMLERLAALLGNEEALVVVCRKDDSATYYTYPTAGRAGIKNAADFCPELRRALASSAAE